MRSVIRAPSHPRSYHLLFTDPGDIARTPAGHIRPGGEMPGVEARLRSEHKRRYLDLDPTMWYQVVPVFPGVTQRMVNMAGERLARLATPKGFTTIRADHLEFRSAPVEAKSQRA